MMAPMLQYRHQNIKSSIVAKREGISGGKGANGALSVVGMMSLIIGLLHEAKFRPDIGVQYQAVQGGELNPTFGERFRNREGGSPYSGASLDRRAVAGGAGGRHGR